MLIIGFYLLSWLLWLLYPQHKYFLRNSSDSWSWDFRVVVFGPSQQCFSCSFICLDEERMDLRASTTPRPIFSTISRFSGNNNGGISNTDGWMSSSRSSLWFAEAVVKAVATTGDPPVPFSFSQEWSKACRAVSRFTGFNFSSFDTRSINIDDSAALGNIFSHNFVDFVPKFNFPQSGNLRTEGHVVSLGVPSASKTNESWSMTLRPGQSDRPAISSINTIPALHMSTDGKAEGPPNKTSGGR